MINKADPQIKGREVAKSRSCLPGYFFLRGRDAWPVGREVEKLPPRVFFSYAVATHYKGRLCTAMADFVLQGLTLHYKDQLCTARANFVLPGLSLYCQG